MSTPQALTSGLGRRRGDVGRLRCGRGIPAAAVLRDPLTCAHGLQRLEDGLRGHVHLQQIHDDSREKEKEGNVKLYLQRPIAPIDSTECSYVVG